MFVVAFLMWRGSLRESWLWAVVALALITITVEGILSVTKFQELRAAGWDGSEPGATIFRERKSERLRRMGQHFEEFRHEWITRIIASWLTLPVLVIAVWARTEPVLDWVNNLRVEQVFFMVAGATALALIDLSFPFELQKRAVLRWAGVLALWLALTTAILDRHPYLLPGWPEAKRLKAEHALAASDIRTTQRHAWALVDYGSQLESQGRIQEAGDLLRTAALLDSTDPGLQEACADFLKRHGTPGEDAAYHKLAADLRSGAASQASDQPYHFEDAPPLPILTANAPPSHAIVLVADKVAPQSMLEILGKVLRAELGVPVYLYPERTGIEQVARGRGPKEPGSFVYVNEAWKKTLTHLPNPPWSGSRQYLIVTEWDIDDDGRGFVYGAKVAPGAGIVSYGRLIPEWPNLSDGRYRSWRKREKFREDHRLLDNLCKQSLATVIQTFTLYPSPDFRDVTAYPYGRGQLDRIGRRPLPATLAAYRRELASWQAVELAK